MAFYGTAAALAISVALHVRSAAEQATRGSAAPAAATPAHPAARSSAGQPSPSPRSSTAAGAGQDEVACATLRKQLDQCRRSSWDIVLKAIEGDARARNEGRAARQGDRDAGTPASGFDEQQAALCEVAEDHLRRHWVAERDNIVATLEGVGTDDWAERWMDKKVDSLEDILGITGQQADLLTEAYTSLWAHHGPVLHGLLSAQPVDFAAVVKAVLDFIREEDKLIASLLGEAAGADYRNSELKSRTAILAIFATFANMPWDDALAW